MATFGTIHAGVRYYLAEGFAVSRCACITCGHTGIVAHWPLLEREGVGVDEARAGDVVQMDCEVEECDGGLLSIVQRCSLDDFSDERHDEDR